MSEGKSIIGHVKTLICDTCKTCEVNAVDDKGNKFIVDAGYCNDGSGYIEINLYDADRNLLEVCRLKDFTDSCQLPYNLIVDEEPDCDCL